MWLVSGTSQWGLKDNHQKHPPTSFLFFGAGGGGPKEGTTMWLLVDAKTAVT